MADLLRLELGVHIWDAIRTAEDFPAERKQLAEAMGISPQYLCDLIAQRKPWRYPLLLRLPSSLRIRALRHLVKSLRDLADSIERANNG